jgi:acyl-[acyl-carrier-protein]-phospholipid O-acyltransferase/long-chain-fatty-acid--[acyl-carrier-protein] ligase
MDTDRFFNALPLFHCFGLTVGLLLPMVTGSFVLLYISPLHYRVVPSAFYNLNCTVLFGTNTLLLGYARKANPYDFRTLRYVFAGAEKLQEATSTLWVRKFGVRVLEGYGATECSPCISVNVPMQIRSGSTGRFLPGIAFRLEHVPGIEAERNSWQHYGPAQRDSAFGISRSESKQVGRLFVRGPNVMRGYLNAQANASFRALDGWYDTGDIVGVDQDGFVYILGRMKRFAKISGEMVGLTAVEDALASAFPHFGTKFAVAIVTRPDEKKGERLVAVANESRLSLAELQDVLKARGFNNLSLPRELKFVKELPRLGTGKVNHRELEKTL